MSVVDGRISIDVGVGIHLEHHDGLPVLVPDVEIEPLTVEAVRATLERLRR